MRNESDPSLWGAAGSELRLPGDEVDAMWGRVRRRRRTRTVVGRLGVGAVLLAVGGVLVLGVRGFSMQSENPASASVTVTCTSAQAVTVKRIEVAPAMGAWDVWRDLCGVQPATDVPAQGQAAGFVPISVCRIREVEYIVYIGSAAQCPNANSGG